MSMARIRDTAACRGRMAATCATIGCHTGTPNSPANKGSVKVTFPNGMTYTPGVKQHLTVTISDPAPTQRAWGFQLTARRRPRHRPWPGSFASRRHLHAIDVLPAATSQILQVITPTAQICPAGRASRVHGAQPGRAIEHTMGQGFGDLPVRLDAAGHQCRQHHRSTWRATPEWRGAAHHERRPHLLHHLHADAGGGASSAPAISQAA